ncbi:hypothetical protein [Nonomuraea jiangxiensis]|uniref:Uncharacterized protein n=1 Tax=Nonomuraea jiangxiensis TaxID=633440 RepID=A0A1G8IKS1_9ACTN|nr:hypothetical protein [Nonomuraea jiangxiensis]SDI19504.1 hypothetical protein SAMN05421869_104522 [Nonomuraea jiangxiensis]
MTAHARVVAVVSYLGLIVAAVLMGTSPAEADSAQAVMRSGAPKGQGNNWNSGNFRNWGRAVNSGNFIFTDASVSSANTFGGGNFANGPQTVTEGKSVRVAK